jgi:hypothetical protein
MNVRILVVGCLLSGGVGACTYDEADQLARLRALAQSVHSGHLNESARKVTWVGSVGEEYSVSYGGCDHLGHEITVANLVKVMPTEPELLEISQKLANEYWQDGEQKLLGKALETGKFTRDISDVRTRFDVTGTHYSEMYVEARQEAGTVVVALGWVRDF